MTIFQLSSQSVVTPMGTVAVVKPFLAFLGFLKAPSIQIDPKAESNITILLITICWSMMSMKGNDATKKNV